MSAPLTLAAAPLTRSAFAPFGDVIETDGAEHYPINNGTTERYHDLARVDVTEAGGCALLNIFRGQPVRANPVPLSLMERHPLASQSFVPLAPRRFLVVVAPPGDAPSSGDLRAFVARVGQGVNYARGVWHHPLLTLDEVTDFLVIDRGGAGHNCDEVPLASPVAVAY